VGYDRDERRLDETTEAIRLTAEVIRGEGVQPALHPHVGTWIETEPEIQYVLDSIPPITLSLGPDTGHLAWAGMRPEHFVREHADRIVAVHIKDVRVDVARRSTDSDLDYRQTVAAGIWAEPGQGDLDLESVLDALPDPRMWVVIEVDRPSDGDVESSLATSANWARALHTAS
jgi:inosose dehydratase